MRGGTTFMSLLKMERSGEGTKRMKGYEWEERPCLWAYRRWNDQVIEWRGMNEGRDHIYELIKDRRFRGGFENGMNERRRLWAYWGWNNQVRARRGYKGVWTRGATTFLSLSKRGARPSSPWILEYLGPVVLGPGSRRREDQLFFSQQICFKSWATGTF